MESAVISLVCFTVSKVFDRSIAIVTVHRGWGHGLLKPVVTLCTCDKGAEARGGGPLLTETVLGV